MLIYSPPDGLRTLSGLPATDNHLQWNIIYNICNMSYSNGLYSNYTDDGAKSCRARGDGEYDRPEPHSLKFSGGRPTVNIIKLCFSLDMFRQPVRLR